MSQAVMGSESLERRWRKPLALTVGAGAALLLVGGLLNPTAFFRAYLVGYLFWLGKQMANRLRHTTRKVGDLAFLDVTGRVARTLLDLSKQPDAMTHPDGMQIKITRQEIGRIVGCSREMVGRVLKTLEDQGLVSVKGKTMVVFGTR